MEGTFLGCIFFCQVVFILYTSHISYVPVIYLYIKRAIVIKYLEIEVDKEAWHLTLV